MSSYEKFNSLIPLKAVAQGLHFSQYNILRKMDCEGQDRNTKGVMLSVQAEQLMRDFDSIAEGLQQNLTSKGCLDKDVSV